MAIVIHDLVMTALAVFVALELRFDEARLAGFLSICRSSSRSHCLAPRSSTGLPTSTVEMALRLDPRSRQYRARRELLGGRLPRRRLYPPVAASARPIYFGKAFVAVYWGLQIFFLGGPRFVYRWWKDRWQKVVRSPRSACRDGAHPRPRARDRSGAARHPGRASGASPARPHLAARHRSRAQHPRRADHRQLRRSRVGHRTTCGGWPHAAAHGACARARSRLPPIPKPSIALARRHGIAVSQTQPLVGTEGAETAPRLAPVAMEDLLLRPAVAIDRARLERLAHGRKFAITGGGGSIGSEIARRLVLFGAARSDDHREFRACAARHRRSLVARRAEDAHLRKALRRARPRARASR